MESTSRHIRRSKHAFREHVEAIHAEQMLPVKQEYLRRRDEVVKEFVIKQVTDGNARKKIIDAAERVYLIGDGTATDQARLVQYAFQHGVSVQSLEDVQREMGVVLRTKEEIRRELEKETASNQPVSKADAKTYFDNARKERGE
jgi:hypothetical protein